MIVSPIPAIFVSNSINLYLLFKIRARCAHESMT